MTRNTDKTPDRGADQEGYEVGYGKPPKHTQFRKGQSGNPKGRPRGRRNGRSIMRELLDRKVTVTENGQTRRVKILEAVIQQMTARALTGSLRDQMQFLKLVEEYAPDQLREEEQPVPFIIEFVESDGNGRPAQK